MIKRGFTNPKLAECGGSLSREWYVGFRHTCTTCNLRKPYQLRLGLNYLKTVAEGKAIEAHPAQSRLESTSPEIKGLFAAPGPR